MCRNFSQFLIMFADWHQSSHKYMVAFLYPIKLDLPFVKPVTSFIHFPHRPPVFTRARRLSRTVNSLEMGGGAEGRSPSQPPDGCLPEPGSERTAGTRSRSAASPQDGACLTYPSRRVSPVRSLSHDPLGDKQSQDRPWGWSWATWKGCCRPLPTATSLCPMVLVRCARLM